MKAKDRSTKLLAMATVLVALAMAWAAWGANRVAALGDNEDTPPPFGLAQGQTARLTVFNSGEAGGYIINWKFLDSEGRTLARSPEPEAIPTEQFRSFDISADSLHTTRDRFGRVQLRAVVTALGGPDTKNLRVSLEVFDNTAGRTTVFITNPSND